MYEKIYKEISKFNKEHLNEKRQKHVKGVVKTAIELAEIYGEDIDKAKLAAVCHDMYRWVKDEKLARYVDSLGLGEKYKTSPNLAHSKLAACIVKRDYDVDDEDIINAISFHTTGRYGMSKLEQIIYLADAIEPNRSYPNVDELRKISKNNLALACLTSLKSTVSFLESQGKEIDYDTLEAVRYFESLKENI